jgi:hypothetical protein
LGAVVDVGVLNRLVASHASKSAAYDRNRRGRLMLDEPKKILISI